MTKDVQIFAETIEPEALAQIEALAEHPVSDGSKIRIMPDVHAGAGCTIGTTMTITDRVCPNLVGVDIGCGMFAVKLDETEIDYAELDKVIRSSVPSGMMIRTKPVAAFDFDKLRCPVADKQRALLSLGTLGGGNHFIEIDKDSCGGLWLIIHSGSRHLGLEVANYYQQLAVKRISTPPADLIKEIAKTYKEQGRQNEIQEVIEKVKAQYRDAKKQKDLAYLEGQDLDDYLNDMGIVQQYAKANREAIANEILRGMSLKHSGWLFHTTHNYIDLQNKILRKGAVSAQLGEYLVIPMNMRDGVFLCTGLGNPDWNYSAPHGAGRIMSRKKAKETISAEDYVASMEGIFTTSVGYGTIDEAPMAYKDADEIRKLIRPTCGVIDLMKPQYNFKASE